MINWIKSKLGYRYCYLIAYFHGGDAYSNNDVTTTKPLSIDDISETREGLFNANDNCTDKNIVIVNIMFMGMKK